jgi:hypothetical protein
MATMGIASSSSTSGAPGIDTSYDDVATNDFISLNCSSAGTSATSGLGPLWLRVTGG